MLLSEYLPPDIVNLRTFTTLLNPEQIEINSLNNSAQDIINQCFVETATWGLVFWESFFGIATNLSKDINYRRTIINAKRRGIGTVTISMIKNVAESFNNGEVDVTEDSANYSFKLTFVSNGGIPQNLSDLKTAIEQIKPAHLGVVYDFKYMVWDALDAKNLTWDQLDAKKVIWDVFETGIW
ncbi:YmfQ family protein [Clostridium tagluense]|uniref:YmfQ family protein n=1 Tax=Clostridium tagluense TaxID=360422 RepID=UPI001C6E64F7|nr:YmfQ family protein [Clostridium tagluense]MBW9158864.1 YmfQ family protein [Clostridium tagluense]WLC67158.1 YmfQ family protein [Clostridium tagluense]